ncbi:DUF2927 domain-containing protein [Jannaschia seosinensis]|uniref:DUF2927 domain-containing protein n=1 Tax=Jannaschia seosinensis TaxID=313367 RepID=UPI001C91AA81|nr:DUF2927 domain-containing protein [Jannaschia seosinensis]
MAPSSGPDVARATPAAMAVDLLPMRRFDGPPRLREPVYPNGQLARDILALTFQLETGPKLPILTRFEGPIPVSVESVGAPPPQTLASDLADLLDRLRREAGIDVRRTRLGEMGSITICALPRTTLQRHACGAACFAVPRVAGWRDYLRRPGADTDWTTLETRNRASIFLPADVSPQELRDCLHEELAQALGPLNDLYRLPNSVFNDDNVHSVLTDFDMLVLRAIYHRDLHSGVTRAEVAAPLPAILDEINPRGHRADTRPVAESPMGWNMAIGKALALRQAAAVRRTSAREAVRIARAEGWQDDRLAMSLLAFGRAAMTGPDEENARIAVTSFLDAARIYRNLHGTGALQSAQVTVHLAVLVLGSGEVDEAIALLDSAIPTARGAQNAARLSTLLMLRARAAHLQGAEDEAAGLRREALSWGRHAWGDRFVTLRAAEVAGLRLDA